MLIEFVNSLFNIRIVIVFLTEHFVQKFFECDFFFHVFFELGFLHEAFIQNFAHDDFELFSVLNG